MKRVAGTFNGTAAALYACIGFVPDWVVLTNLEDADDAVYRWDRNMMRSADRVQGTSYVGADVQGAALTTTGIEPYYGSDLMTSTNQTSVTYGRRRLPDFGITSTTVTTPMRPSIQGMARVQRLIPGRWIPQVA